MSVYEGCWANFSFLREGRLLAQFAQINLDIISSSSSDDVGGFFALFEGFFFAPRPVGRECPWSTVVGCQEFGVAGTLRV